MSIKNFAGVSMKGGRRDNFVFCLLEHFKDEDRWFLKSLLQVKDEEGLDGDDAIRSWIEQYDIQEIVVDFPLSNPACQTCDLVCPGLKKCPRPEVYDIYKKIDHLLIEDQKIREQNPKRYEQDRNRDDEVDFSRDIFETDAHHHILSRSFKRRLKKGFLPYWNRPIDLWVWSLYYDQLLHLFKSSYDSFGNTSLMMLHRFSYLKRHFPSGLSFFESNVNIILIELLRAKIILKKDILNMGDLDLAPEAKLDIIKKIETKFNIFIYDHDLEILVKNPRAFDSFILSVAGFLSTQGKVKDLPEWARPSECQFLSPKF